MHQCADWPLDCLFSRQNSVIVQLVTIRDLLLWVVMHDLSWELGPAENKNLSKDGKQPLRD